ncbi:MAG: lipid-A-disaccharide synthase N-terminal domain-containing protein [Candidatus Brocadiia bacterium]|jgi:lipid-A-disaccharide synthase-like uncharacterized protein|nr:lipid-A-disaccharide synthase N-terminal domain-containing protein [Candidatus Brocadiia bacterium]
MNGAWLLATVDAAERGELLPSSDMGWFLFCFGLAAQGVFTARFVVQWIASERRGKSHIPLVFWYLSLIGAAMLFTYALVAKRDPVIALGQTIGIVVYVRNLMLLRKEKKQQLAETG